MLPVSLAFTVLFMVLLGFLEHKGSVYSTRAEPKQKDTLMALVVITSKQGYKIINCGNSTLQKTNNSGDGGDIEGEKGE